jgi:hypothetical protein
MPDRPGARLPLTPPPPSIPEEDRTPPGGTALWRCPRCGSTDLAPAYLVDYSDKFRQLQLAPRALKLATISRLLRPFKRMVNVGASVCRDCGLVLLEVDPDEFVEAERRFGRR